MSLRGPIIEQITHVGQPYVDDPVYARPRPVCCAMAEVFGRKPPPGILVRHQRIALNWKRPDGKGGTKPR